MVAEVLVYPSTKLSAADRSKARLLSAMLLVRLLLLFGVGCFALLADSELTHVPLEALAAGLLSTVFAYSISRTSFYRLAAYQIILETMVGVLVVSLLAPYPLVIQNMPYWLCFGVFISGMVLPVKQTILVIIGSAGVFLALSVIVPAEQLPVLGAALIHFCYCTVFVALGATRGAD